MTPKEQRIAIAEACGWKWVGHPDQVKATQGFTMPEKWVLSPDGEKHFRHDIPDYLTDLNAMHEAEKMLDFNQLKDMEESISFHFGITPFHATAAQRAEAFLKTLNLWKE